MRLSTKGRYAVMAMADLAKNGSGRAVSLAEIATRQEISLSYLEQLFARLRKGGLVKSVRGPGGGYRLAKAPGETVVAEIVLAVDEPIRATRCASHGGPRGCMMGGERCITHDLWEDLGQEIHRYLAGVSLADVIERRTGRARMSPQNAQPLEAMA
ncbi:Rrf2 family transcriptional regulator [Brevundimonas naejangsanensis]|uniref:Rrf2 family transcriptional regulator n=1 Tax=Brevundimonas naejangsanensis TaxID=588932 RepID=A0A494RK63_9CAUL|nr:Rrf2 family transcriptional regulator [Brevundimonas naejangsanensis]AYG95859.1 Rrf2 family transcriptional regulator [Brevundimonas naejangsanensis]